MSFRPVLLSLLATFWISPVLAQTVVVTTPGGRETALAVPDLATLPRARVTLKAHGERHDYEGPLLIDVLAKAGVPTGKALHGATMANVVVVEASDGYRVAFGLAEADPNTRANKIILADREDGAPLTMEEGPFRLVVEGDLRPARSVRMVRRIVVSDVADAVSR